MNTSMLFPHQTDKLFLTDAGLETTLIFSEGLDLPHFAACDLLFSEEGTQQLRAYFRSYADMAKEKGVGFIVESPTWRANPSWGEVLGYSKDELEKVNHMAIGLCYEIRANYQSAECPIFISGCIGPKGDGYIPSDAMSITEAMQFHSVQVNMLKDAGADFVSGFTMSYIEEAIGLALAAKEASIPAVISFTVETDGHLPSEQSLAEAIQAVDEATDSYPSYYMVNCAHPSHFNHTFGHDNNWQKRIGGIRANASCKSHAELDESTELDEGDEIELGALHYEMLKKLPNVNVLGGCCGTSHKHIHQIHQACQHHFTH